MTRRHSLTALALPALLAVALFPGCADDACDGAQLTCDDVCVDARFDPDNCGACGNACDAGSVCSQGVCADTCSEGTLQCDDRCVDARFDPSNCGACGNTCDEGLMCSDGACGLECAGGTSECDALCVDTAIDPLNCGGCGTACGVGELCIEGACTQDCGEGLTVCSNACGDTETDPANCGGCDIVCDGAQACIEGGCVDAAPIATVRTGNNDGHAGQDLYLLREHLLVPEKINNTTFAAETVADSVITPQGDIVFVAAQEQEGRRDLYLAPADGSPVVRLSPIPFVNGDVQPGVVVQGGRAFYRADHDTDGMFELFMVPLDSPGAATKVSGAMPADGDVGRGFSVSGDGNNVLYLADADTDETIEAYVVDLSAAGTATKANGPLQTDGNVLDARMTSDAGTVVYRASRNFEYDTELCRVDMANPGTCVKLGPSMDGGEGTVGNFTITPDDSAVVFTSDLYTDREGMVLRTVDLSTDAVSRLSGDGPYENVSPDFKVSSDGSRVYFRHFDGGEGMTLASVDITNPGIVTQISAPTDMNYAHVGSWTLNASETHVVYADGGEGFSHAPPVTDPPSGYEDTSRGVYLTDLSTPGTTVQLTPPLIDDASYSGGFIITDDASTVVLRGDLEKEHQRDTYVVHTDEPGVLHRVDLSLGGGRAEAETMQLDASGTHAFFIGDFDTEDRHELYRVALDAPGAATHVNAPLEVGQDVREFAISPDGSAAVYMLNGDGGDTLWWVNVDSPGVATEISIQGELRYLSDLAIAPDNATVVYRGEDDDYVQQAYAVNVADPTTVLDIHPSLSGNQNVYDFAFTPNGSHILLRARIEATNRTDLYAVAMNNLGVLTRLNSDTANRDVHEFKVSHDSSFVVYRGEENNDNVRELYRVSIDTPAAPVRISEPLGGNADVQSGFDIAPNDLSVVYRAGGSVWYQYELFRADFATPEVSVKLSEPFSNTNGDVFDFQITADSSSVVYRSNHARDYIEELFIVDLAAPAGSTRIHTPIVNGDVYDRWSLSPTGSVVVYRARVGNETNLYMADLTELGTSTMVARRTASGSYAWDIAVTPLNEGVFVGYIHGPTTSEVFKVTLGTTDTPTLMSPWLGATDSADLQSF